jgi:hypothetical protein
MLKVLINMLNVCLYIIHTFSIYMVNVLLVTDNATKNRIHGSLDMVNILRHGKGFHAYATCPTQHDVSPQVHVKRLTGHGKHPQDIIEVSMWTLYL